MNYSRRTFGLGILIFVLGMISGSHSAQAQVDAKTTTSVARGREQYEASMERIRRDIRAQLEALKDQAKRLKENTEAVKTAIQAERDFEVSGIVPESKARDRIVQDYAKAAAAMQKIYNDAMLAEGGEAVFAPEVAQFRTHWDLNPWESKAAKDSKLEVRDAPLFVEIGAKGEYRLEIRATRVGDNGTLWVEFPLTDGKRLAVPSLVDDKGEARVLLTVRDDSVVADLGVARPVDLTRAIAGEGTSVKLHAAEGAFVVDGLRAKAIVDGEPPELEARTSSVKSPKSERPPENLYVVGRSWTGTFDGDVRTVRLTSVNGERVSFEVPGSYQGSMWRLSGKLRGGAVTVDNIERIANPPGHQAVTVRTQRGSIRIKRNGRLDMNCEVNGRHAGDSFVGTWRTTDATPN